jgi:regulator of sigma E protease
VPVAPGVVVPVAPPVGVAAGAQISVWPPAPGVPVAAAVLVPVAPAVAVPVPVAAGEAAGRAGGAIWRVTSGTVSAIAHIFESQQRKKLTGVVGISEVTHQAFSYGVREALTLIAVISLSLAIVNLFPFLPLDGGHIFWSLVEKLRGRPVPFSVIERASAVGFVLVMIMFAIGLSNDIGRLTGPGFKLR